MECGMSVWMELLGRCFLREGEVWGEIIFWGIEGWILEG